MANGNNSLVLKIKECLLIERERPILNKNSSFNLFLSRIASITIISLYKNIHCVKSVRIRSYSGPYFPAFGLNTERYSVSLRILSKCGKMLTRITPNTDTFYAVSFIILYDCLVTAL